MVKVHLLLFWISSAKAIPLIVFEVNEKIGPYDGLEGRLTYWVGRGNDDVRVVLEG